MKLLFEEFIYSSPVLRGLENNPVAKHIYDEIIWNDDFRIEMIAASELRLPALTGCVIAIENYCDEHPGFDLSVDLNKQSVGRMVAASVAPFGYTKTGNKRLASAMNLRYFVNAGVFSLTENPKQKIVKQIIDC